jgi:branched-chain amino acid transport system ATP-binding protein
VAPGQIVGILGTNGAGKSTLLRAISGFHGLDDAEVTEGTVTFKQRRIENSQPHATTKLGIALVPEREKVFPNLTVAENLQVPVAAHAGRPEQRRREARVYQFFPRLSDLRQRTAGLLSGGERQMLAIAGALVCRPELLLVDELSLGLAPVSSTTSWAPDRDPPRAVADHDDRGAERRRGAAGRRLWLCAGERSHRARW